MPSPLHLRRSVGHFFEKLSGSDKPANRNPAVEDRLTPAPMHYQPVNAVNQARRQRTQVNQMSRQGDGVAAGQRNVASGVLRHDDRSSQNVNRFDTNGRRYKAGQVLEKLVGLNKGKQEIGPEARRRAGMGETAENLPQRQRLQYRQMTMLPGGGPDWQRNLAGEISARHYASMASEPAAVPHSLAEFSRRAHLINRGREPKYPMVQTMRDHVLSFLNTDRIPKDADAAALLMKAIDLSHEVRGTRAAREAQRLVRDLVVYERQTQHLNAGIDRIYDRPDNSYVIPADERFLGPVNSAVNSAASDPIAAAAPSPNPVGPFVLDDIHDSHRKILARLERIAQRMEAPALPRRPAPVVPVNTRPGRNPLVIDRGESSNTVRSRRDSIPPVPPLPPALLGHVQVSSQYQADSIRQITSLENRGMVREALDQVTAMLDQERGLRGEQQISREVMDDLTIRQARLTAKLSQKISPVDTLEDYHGATLRQVRKNEANGDLEQAWAIVRGLVAVEDVAPPEHRLPQRTLEPLRRKAAELHARVSAERSAQTLTQADDPEARGNFQEALDIVTARIMSEARLPRGKRMLDSELDRVHARAEHLQTQISIARVVDNDLRRMQDAHQFDEAISYLDAVLDPNRSIRQNRQFSDALLKNIAAQRDLHLGSHSEVQRALRSAIFWNLEQLETRGELSTATYLLRGMLDKNQSLRQQFTFSPRLVRDLDRKLQDLEARLAARARPDTRRKTAFSPLLRPPSSSTSGTGQLNSAESMLRDIRSEANTAQDHVRDVLLPAQQKNRFSPPLDARNKTGSLKGKEVVQDIAEDLEQDIQDVIARDFMSPRAIRNRAAQDLRGNRLSGLMDDPLPASAIQTGQFVADTTPSDFAEQQKLPFQTSKIFLPPIPSGADAPAPTAPVRETEPEPEPDDILRQFPQPPQRASLNYSSLLRDIQEPAPVADPHEDNWLEFADLARLELEQLLYPSFQPGLQGNSALSTPEGSLYNERFEVAPLSPRKDAEEETGERKDTSRLPSFDESAQLAHRISPHISMESLSAASSLGNNEESDIDSSPGRSRFTQQPIAGTAGFVSPETGLESRPVQRADSLSEVGELADTPYGFNRSAVFGGSTDSLVSTASRAAVHPDSQDIGLTPTFLPNPSTASLASKASSDNPGEIGAIRSALQLIDQEKYGVAIEEIRNTLQDLVDHADIGFPDGLKARLERQLLFCLGKQARQLLDEKKFVEFEATLASFFEMVAQDPDLPIPRGFYENMQMLGVLNKVEEIEESLTAKKYIDVEQKLDAFFTQVGNPPRLQLPDGLLTRMQLLGAENQIAAEMQRNERIEQAESVQDMEQNQLSSTFHKQIDELVNENKFDQALIELSGMIEDLHRLSPSLESPRSATAQERIESYTQRFMEIHTQSEQAKQAASQARGSFQG